MIWHVHQKNLTIIRDISLSCDLHTSRTENDRVHQGLTNLSFVVADGLVWGSGDEVSSAFDGILSCERLSCEWYFTHFADENATGTFWFLSEDSKRRCFAFLYAVIKRNEVKCVRPCPHRFESKIERLPSTKTRFCLSFFVFSVVELYGAVLDPWHREQIDVSKKCLRHKESYTCLHTLSLSLFIAMCKWQSRWDNLGGLKV